MPAKETASPRGRKKAASTNPEFVLKFDGQPDYISASTFLESLSGVSAVIQEANRELGTGDPLNIKIRAPRPGSFLVHLLLDATSGQQVANLFTIGSGLIAALAGSIQLWQLLKGQPPKSVTPQADNKVTIESESGSVEVYEQKIANLVINNSNVSFNLARTFGALDSDPNVTALEVLDRDGRKKLAEVKRDDFASLATAPAPIDSKKRGLVTRARVNIIKPSFDRKLRWELVFNGNRIGAVITDPKFNEDVDGGKKFSKGDTLDVMLRVKQLYDPAVGTYINKEYEIVEVIGHVARPEQTGFPFKRRVKGKKSR